jgi:hypothetical protein
VNVHCSQKHLFLVHSALPFLECALRHADAPAAWVKLVQRRFLGSTPKGSQQPNLGAWYRLAIHCGEMWVGDSSKRDMICSQIARSSCEVPEVR